MKPIFCGNFEYDARQSELERLFGKYGKVDRVDMKTGFAFIYMEDERDAEDAIRALDRREFGRQGRRLRVEWTKQERGIKRPGGGGGGGGGGGSRKSTNNRPSKTLFVINFDPYNTKTRDLERHFDSYGKIASVRIRRNFAFVQYESVEDASKALDATNMSKLMDRVISVEYAVRVDDEKRDRYSPERSRDRSLERGRDRRRSPSPYRRRERGSPDYGRDRSQSPYRKEERVSPNYDRARSPSPRRGERGRTHRDRDLTPTRREASSDRGRGTSPSPRGRDKDSSPTRREKVSSDRGRGTSPSPRGRDRGSSPARREKVSSDHDRGTSPSPRGRNRASSPSNGRDPSQSPYKRKRSSPANGLGRVSSPSPVGRDGANLDNSVPKARVDSPNDDGAESPVNERYRSRSPEQVE